MRYVPVLPLNKLEEQPVSTTARKCKYSSGFLEWPSSRSELLGGTASIELEIWTRLQTILVCGRVLLPELRRHGGACLMHSNTLCIFSLCVECPSILATSSADRSNFRSHSSYRSMARALLRPSRAISVLKTLICSLERINLSFTNSALASSVAILSIESTEMSPKSESL